MFELSLSYKEKNLDVIYLRCINCKRETGLFLKNTFYEMITKFVLNAILHHVGKQWIISSNKKKLKYEIDENNHQDWLNKSPWYKT